MTTDEEQLTVIRRKYVSACRKYSYYITILEDLEKWFRKNRQLRKSKVFQENKAKLKLVQKIIKVLKKIKKKYRAC